MAGDGKNDKVIKYTSLVVLVLQNTSLVLFMRYAMTGNRPKFLKAITVFYGEVFKCIASIILVCLGEKSLRRGLAQIYDQFVNHWQDALKVLVPAVVYTIQNFLLYVAVDNLPAATYMVTYQLKILTTAIFTVFVLKRKLSVQQWIALIFLFAGVVIVQYDTKISKEKVDAAKIVAFPEVESETFPPAEIPHFIGATDTPGPEILDAATTEAIAAAAAAGASATSTLPPVEQAFNAIMDSVSPATTANVTEAIGLRVKRGAENTGGKHENSIAGFIAVLVACCLSGFAGIYFEKILKGSEVSIWIRNIQLALPSIFFALIFAFVKDNDEIFGDGINPAVVFSRMMQGFDWAVWVTVGISALGGLIVAVVIKYADNILKAFATSFAIVLNCFLAYFLFDFTPSLLFALGAALVIGAVFVYSMYPYRTPHQPLPTTEAEAEMTELKNVAVADSSSLPSSKV